MSTKELALFDELKAAVTLFVGPTKQIAVTDAQTNLAASTALRQVKDMQKTLEARRKEHTAPLLERKRAIDAYCDEINSPLKMAEDHIKNQQRVWAIAEQKRIEDERRHIEAEERTKEEAARKERERIEREAREKQEAEARAIAADQERQRKELADKQRAKLEAMKAFGVDPDAERKAAEAEAEALRKRQEDERLAAQKRAEESRLADEVKRDREAKERAAEASKRQRELEAAKPKNTVTVKKFRLIDIGKVPAQYLLLNEVEVRKAMLAGIAVPGVEYFTEMDVRNRWAARP